MTYGQGLYNISYQTLSEIAGRECHQVHIAYSSYSLICAYRPKNGQEHIFLLATPLQEIVIQNNSCVL